MDRTQLRILIVDDFNVARAIVKNVLLELGYKDIQEAEDGGFAVQMIQDAQTAGTPFKVVFCDYNMPRMNGLQLLQTCKQTPGLENLSFIMLTAEGEPTTAIQAIKAGAIDYMVKPISPEKIATRLEKVMAKLSSRP